LLESLAQPKVPWFFPFLRSETVVILVKSVASGSLGAELGLTPGTELLTIDGRRLNDFLDWEFLAAEEHFVLLVRGPDGTTTEYDIERSEGDSLGIELEPPRVRRCANRCDFCFVDGNPEGMRPALYIRDDDYRLSFRYGNFATLTNLKQGDIDRIVEYRLTPLYVSVHATDPVTRRRLLRNPKAPDILSQLKFFGEAAIQCHTQIVLQPGVNDGAVLRQSLEDLFEFGDTVLSVSVVPVGLTDFSRHDLVRGLTAAECLAAISTVDEFAAIALKDRAYHWAYGSDDLYCEAGIPLPPTSRYDGFEQVENGVGSVRYLQERISGLDTDWSGSRIGVTTGVAMEHLMPQVITSVAAAAHASFELLVLQNDLFGQSVTTAGLLAGRTFVKALVERSDLDLALIPAEAVSDGVFIDDMTLDEVESSVPPQVRISYHFSDALGGRGEW
jgi:putative radical SAM enzyme (TIGR03279 family)